MDGHLALEREVGAVALAPRGSAVEVQEGRQKAHRLPDSAKATVDILPWNGKLAQLFWPQEKCLRLGSTRKRKGSKHPPPSLRARKEGVQSTPPL